MRNFTSQTIFFTPMCLVLLSLGELFYLLLLLYLATDRQTDGFEFPSASIVVINSLCNDRALAPYFDPRVEDTMLKHRTLNDHIERYYIRYSVLVIRFLSSRNGCRTIIRLRIGLYTLRLTQRSNFAVTVNS